MAYVDTDEVRPAHRGAPSSGDGTAVRVHDRYLSDRALLEAAAALRALAATLGHVRCPFTDDAAVDAARLASLAEDLSAWSREQPAAGTALDESARAGTQHWLGLLGVYFRPALRPSR